MKGSALNKAPQAQAAKGTATPIKEVSSPIKQKHEVAPSQSEQMQEAEIELEKMMVGHKMIQAEQEIEALKLSLETERLQVFTLRSTISQHKEQVDLLRQTIAQQSDRLLTSAEKIEVLSKGFDVQQKKLRKWADLYKSLLSQQALMDHELLMAAKGASIAAMQTHQEIEQLDVERLRVLAPKGCPIAFDDKFTVIATE